MKRILLALCAIVILLSGCNSDQTDMVTKSEQDLVGAYIPEEYIEDLKRRNADDSWKYEVADRLLNEFCYFYDNMEEKEYIEELATKMLINSEDLSYNCIMALDRLVGISRVYYKYLSDEKMKIFNERFWAMEYASRFSDVRFAYTDNGLHYIAIYDGEEVPDYSNVQDKAINQLRGLDDEAVFLKESYQNSDYIFMDIFVEDLFDKNREYIPIDVSIDDEPRYRHVGKVTEKCQQFLNNYNRNFLKQGDLAKSNDWNLVLFRCIKIPYNYENFIEIVSDYDKVKLTYFGPFH